MRYLLDTAFEKEIASREEFLFDTLHLYFLPRSKSDGFITMAPVGTARSDVLFLVGHYDTVKYWLSHNSKSIQEKIIVIVSCFGSNFTRWLKNKTVFISNSDSNGFCTTYEGSEYGFGFDITESELRFYTSKGDELITRLTESFERIRR